MNSAHATPFPGLSPQDGGEQPSAPPERLPGIDRLRGLVIMLMALDHVRDFFHGDAIRFSPTDLTHTYPALFLTRFVTHYCAPTFVLLAGVSAWLAASRFARRRDHAWFLLTRGLFLILLDAYVVSPVWGMQFGRIGLGALWAIGAGMASLSALIFLPTAAVLALGLAIVAGHDLLDATHAADVGALAPFWPLLHERGPLPFGLNGSVWYPALPWIGIIAIGYGLGPLFAMEQARRRRLLTLTGISAIALFIVLRALNRYGDAAPWSVQPAPVMTALSFLNVSKYPPSLLYALVTLGPALMLLPQLERLHGRAADVLATFGKSSLFFYVLHLYAAALGGFALAYARGFDMQQIGAFMKTRAAPETFGLGLGATYLVWLALLAALYPLCRWYAGFRRRRRWTLLTYL